MQLKAFITISSRCLAQATLILRVEEIRLSEMMIHGTAPLAITGTHLPYPVLFYHSLIQLPTMTRNMVRAEVHAPEQSGSQSQSSSMPSDLN
jgi:hypothetical protein